MDIETQFNNFLREIDCVGEKIPESKNLFNINKDIAFKLYMKYVEEDDKKIIKNIKLLKNYYEHFHNLRLRSALFNWRKVALKMKTIKTKENGKIHQNNQSNSATKQSSFNGKNLKHQSYQSYQSNTGNIKSVISDFSENDRSILQSYDSGVKYHYDDNFNGLNIRQREVNYYQAKKQNNVFERLYMDSYKKDDIIAYNNELKDVRYNSKYN